MWANKWCHLVEWGNCKFATWKPRREDMNLLSSHIEKKKKRVVKRNVETISGSCVTTHFWIGWDGFFLVGCPGRDAEEFTCASQSTHSSCNTAIWHKKGELFKNNTTTRFVIIFNPFIKWFLCLFFWKHWKCALSRQMPDRLIYPLSHFAYLAFIPTFCRVDSWVAPLRPNQFVRLSRPNLSAFSQQGAKRFSPSCLVQMHLGDPIFI